MGKGWRRSEEFRIALGSLLNREHVHSAVQRARPFCCSGVFPLRICILLYGAKMEELTGKNCRDSPEIMRAGEGGIAFYQQFRRSCATLHRRASADQPAVVLLRDCMTLGKKAGTLHAEVID